MEEYPQPNKTQNRETGMGKQAQHDVTTLINGNCRIKINDYSLSFVTLNWVCN